MAAARVISASAQSCEPEIPAMRGTSASWARAEAKIRRNPCNVRSSSSRRAALSAAARALLLARGFVGCRGLRTRRAEGADIEDSSKKYDRNATQGHRGMDI